MNIIERKPTRYRYKITVISKGKVCDVVYNGKDTIVMNGVSDSLSFSFDALKAVYEDVLQDLLNKGYKEDDVVVEKIPYCVVNRFNEV